VKNRWEALKGLRIYRAWRLFSESGGTLSAAGMSFQGLFAVFAGIWIGFQFLGAWLNTAPEIAKAVVEFVNAQIPGLIKAGGPIDPSTFRETTGWDWSSAVAVVLLAWTAIAWLNYTRIAIRRLFNLPSPPINALLLKVYDLAIALIFGLFILASASASVFLTNFFSTMAAWLGLQTDTVSHRIGFQIGGFLIVYGIDVLILAGMIYLLSGIPIPPRRLFGGVALGALALDGLKIAAGYALTSAGHNPLFASFAIFVGLLIWFNLACRVYLLTVAWIGTGLEKDNVIANDLGWIVPPRSSRK
jgi:membrane protein